MAEGSEGIQVTKIPMLRPDEFDLWKNRIRQYMLLTDYQMWEVVVNGPPVTLNSDGVPQPRSPPTSEAERKVRSIEYKALSTLLLSIPNEYQRRFEACQDAKVLMEAIEKRFGGNDNTKKNKRSLLKQQYENFNSAKSETLTQTFDRFSKLVGDLENHQVKIDKDDLNRKFLRSLGDEWTMYTVGLRQSSDLEAKELEDIYNDLRNFEAEVEIKKVGYGSNNNNSAFMSMAGSGSKAESSQKGSSYGTRGSGSITNHSNDQILESFFASNVNSSLTNEDLDQFEGDDLEEMDIKLQIALITQRAKRFMQRTGRNNFAQKRSDSTS